MEAAWLALAEEQDWLDGEQSSVGPDKGFTSVIPGWVGFLRHSIFEPGEPQSENACGFFQPVSLALEKGVPETAKYKDCKSSAYRQQRQHGRAGFRLSRFARRFDDYAMLFC